MQRLILFSPIIYHRYYFNADSVALQTPAPAYVPVTEGRTESTVCASVCVPSCLDLAAASGYWDATLRMLSQGAVRGLQRADGEKPAVGTVRVILIGCDMLSEGMMISPDLLPWRSDHLWCYLPLPLLLPPQLNFNITASYHCHITAALCPLTSPSFPPVTPIKGSEKPPQLLLHCAALAGRSEIFGKIPYGLTVKSSRPADL